MCDKSVDLTLVNVTLPLHAGPQDAQYTLEISDGRWQSIIRQVQTVQAGEALWSDQATTAPVVDAAGAVLLPGLVDCHMHLDKALTFAQIGNRSGTLREAIDNYRTASVHFDKQQIKSRMQQTIELALSYGTTAIRTHLDFAISHGREVVQRTMEAALELKAAYVGLVDIQLVPMYPSHDRTLATRSLYEEIVNLGCDAIGGAPHLSSDPKRDLIQLFQLADKLGKPLDLHTDENDDPAVKTVDMIASLTLSHGMEGRVAVGHLCSLAGMDEKVAWEIMAHMANAQLQAVTLPGANMYLQGRGDRGKIRRGVTRVKELRQVGVPVAVASDNVQDPFHPYGRADLIQIGLLASYATHMTSNEDVLALASMITEVPAAVMGLTDYGVAVDCEANFVLLDAKSVVEMFAWLPVNRRVYRKGRWLRSSRFMQERHGDLLV